MKLAEDAELTEKRKHAEQKMQFEIQEKLAEKAAKEAEEIERILREKEDEARLLAAEVELMKEDAEAAIRWTHRTLQDQAARDAMTASLDLWMWPSDGQDSEGNPSTGVMAYTKPCLIP